MFAVKEPEEETVSPLSPQPQPKLPPPPPLARAPPMYYKTCSTSLTCRAAPSATQCPVSKTMVRLTERKYPPTSNGDGVSKLVMKNISQGTRKKALIHSIPKFSQVLPNQQLAEVQRVLQERLLKKKVRTEQDAHASNNNVDRRASDILQSMVDMSQLVDKTATKLKHRPRRGRKPHKNDIYHLKPNHVEHMDDDHESTGSSQDNQQSTSRPQSQNDLNDWLSVRPELTVTFKSSRPNGQEPAPPQDLSTTP